ncbi:MAG: hypothetical protein FWD40_11315 [Treponema sp.]|nr:hypothetical protein [Treponema sp.]
MKTIKNIWLFSVIIIMLLSCNRNTKPAVEQTAFNENAVETGLIKVDLVEIEIKEDIYDLLTSYYWRLSDGRRHVDWSISTYDWVGDMTPRVSFKKLELPQDCNLYQVRLRNELFYLLYQTKEEENILYPIGSVFGTDPFEIVFSDDFTSMRRIRNGGSWGRSNREGEQSDPDYPLVGIWGSLPSLSEYRLLDYADCVLYMEIDREIPFWAVRRGTYLLKQTEENVFETISSFPDGRLKLEKLDSWQFLITPLFTAPDEEGLTDILTMNRSSIRIEDLIEEDYIYE